jgi:hypothetical protein
MGGKRLRGRVVPRLTDTEDPLPSTGAAPEASRLRDVCAGSLQVPCPPGQKKTQNVNGQVQPTSKAPLRLRHNVAVSHWRETQR